MAVNNPSGLWSGGRTLLSTSWSDNEVRAHRMPAVEAAPVPDRTGSRADPAGSVPAIGDPGLRTAIRRALATSLSWNR